MAIAIVEIKARCTDPDALRQRIMAFDPKVIGTDHQVDTYFGVPNGRLKLRRGNIENTLIAYGRPNISGPKLSNVSLYKPLETEQLYTVLTKALPVLVEVDKSREIYFVDNVKFHIDEVVGLGSFMEIEAIDETGSVSTKVLREQCDFYCEVLGVKEKDLIDRSYSDLLLDQHSE